MGLEAFEAFWVQGLGAGLPVHPGPVLRDQEFHALGGGGGCRVLRPLNPEPETLNPKP